MRKKIITKVLDMKKKLQDDPVAADANQKRSQAAIIGGIRSVAWKTYMEHFVDKENEHADQLMRLLATDGTDKDEALNRARAYLVANGMCGQGTRDLFDENVNTIDGQLPGV